MMLISVISEFYIHVTSSYYREFNASTKFVPFSAIIGDMYGIKTYWFCMLEHYADLLPGKLADVEHMYDNQLSDKSFDGKECGSRTPFMSDSLSFEYNLHDELVKEDEVLVARLCVITEYELIGFKDVKFMRRRSTLVPFLDLTCKANCDAMVRNDRPVVLEAISNSYFISWEMEQCPDVYGCVNLGYEQIEFGSSKYFSSILTDENLFGNVSIISRASNNGYASKLKHASIATAVYYTEVPEIPSGGQCIWMDSGCDGICYIRLFCTQWISTKPLSYRIFEESKLIQSSMSGNTTIPIKKELSNYSVEICNTKKTCIKPQVLGYQNITVYSDEAVMNKILARTALNDTEGALELIQVFNFNKTDFYEMLVNYKPVDIEGSYQLLSAFNLFRTDKNGTTEGSIATMEIMARLGSSIKYNFMNYDKIIDVASDEYLTYSAKRLSRFENVSTKLDALRLMRNVTRAKFSTLIPNEDGHFSTGEFSVAGKRILADRHAVTKRSTGKISPYKFSLFQTETGTLSVPPTNDDLCVEVFNLPEDAKIHTDDGQSPFAAFFSTGWFEPDPAIPEFIEYNSAINTQSAVFHSGNISVNFCEETDDECFYGNTKIYTVDEFELDNSFLCVNMTSRIGASKIHMFTRPKVPRFLAEAEAVSQIIKFEDEDYGAVIDVNSVLNSTPSFIGIEFAAPDNNENMTFNFTYSINAAYCQRWVTEEVDGKKEGKFTRENCKTIRKRVYKIRKALKLILPAIFVKEFIHFLENC